MHLDNYPGSPSTRCRGDSGADEDTAVTTKQAQSADIRRLRTDYELPEYYDLRTAHITEDIGFYASLFPNKDIALLELGCGTGRILAGLAKQGYNRLVGIDKCKHMLNCAKEKLGSFNVDLHQLDVGRRLGAANRKRLGRVDAILLAFNVFHEIGPILRRQRCLENCHDLLEDRACIVIDSRIPPFFRHGTRKVREKLIQTFVDASGNFVESYVSLEANFVQQTLKGNATYRVYDQKDGVRKDEYRAPIRSWLTKPNELLLLAKLCGLNIQHQWGSYYRSPYRVNSERHIVILRKA